MGDYSSVNELIRAEIATRGPIPFERFMEAALSTPGLGYYTRPVDPFGKRGDFFTAEQLQPVFGLLIARMIASLQPDVRDEDRFQVVELGPGRGEMAEYLSVFRYTGVDAGDELPPNIIGVVFANEFLDALPVRVFSRRESGFSEQYVAMQGDGYSFVDGPPCEGPAREYLDRYHGGAPPGSVIEVNLRALEWIRKLGNAIQRGFVILVDYGYTSREWVRHSHGTLMSYERHQAMENVLSRPGDRDITAHVAWTPVQDVAAEAGFETCAFENLSAFLLRAAGDEGLDAVLATSDPREALRRRLQLKTLLFGMGETFRVLTLRKS